MNLERPQKAANDNVSESERRAERKRALMFANALIARTKDRLESVDMDKIPESELLEIGAMIAALKEILPSVEKHVEEAEANIDDTQVYTLALAGRDSLQ